MGPHHGDGHLDRYTASGVDFRGRASNYRRHDGRRSKGITLCGSRSCNSALDTHDLPSALAPLQQAAPHIDVIEVGTILCLSEGMGAVRVIRSLFPDKTILADVRIAEAGGIIAKMAFEAGADWVSVVSGAAPSTAEVVYDVAQQYGGDVQIELSDGWTWEQAARWRDIGIGQAIIHRSRDAEAQGELAWGSEGSGEYPAPR